MVAPSVLGLSSVYLWRLAFTGWSPYYLLMPNVCPSARKGGKE
jgi:hypothetical protein